MLVQCGFMLFRVGFFLMLLFQVTQMVSSQTVKPCDLVQPGIFRFQLPSQ